MFCIGRCGETLDSDSETLKETLQENDWGGILLVGEDKQFKWMPICIQCFIKFFYGNPPKIV